MPGISPVSPNGAASPYQATPTTDPTTGLPMGLASLFASMPAQGGMSLDSSAGLPGALSATGLSGASSSDIENIISSFMMPPPAPAPGGIAPASSTAGFSRLYQQPQGAQGPQ